MARFVLKNVQRLPKIILNWVGGDTVNTVHLRIGNIWYVCRMYRILKQFRTRKAHCWVIRDKDLLRYLSFAVTVTVVYLLAWTVVCLDFFRDDGKLLYEDAKRVACRPQWWYHITEFGKFTVNIFSNFIRIWLKNQNRFD